MISKKHLSLKITGIFLILFIMISVLGSFSVTNTNAEIIGSGALYEIGFNCEHPDLMNEDVRRGLSHLVDRESLLNFFIENAQFEFGEGFLGVTPWNPTMPWYNPDLEPDGKIAKGLKLIEKAGYELFNEEETLKLTFLVPNTNPLRIQWSEMIAEAWNSFGLSIDVVIMGWFDEEDPYGGLMPRSFMHQALSDDDPTTKIPSFEEGGYDILTIGIGFGIYDPPIDLIIDGNWAEWLYTNSASNYYQYSNDKFDKKIDEWILNGGGTQELAYDIQNILQKNPPSIVLFGFIDL